MTKWEIVESEYGTWELGDVPDVNGRQTLILIFEGNVFVAKCKIEGHMLCKKDFESEPGDVEITSWDDYIELQFDEWAQEEIYKQAQKE